MKQIFPPSITGKGAQSTAGANASVLDHAYGRGDPYTLGVEEEYMLLDPETWDLVQHIDSMLARVTDEGEFEARINPELMQSVLEITTPVCHTAGEVAESLRTLRSYVARSRARKAAASPLQARTRSASSSGSASRRRTATARSSTSSSTSRAAS